MMTNRFATATAFAKWYWDNTGTDPNERIIHRSFRLHKDTAITRTLTRAHSGWMITYHTMRGDGDIWLFDTFEQALGFWVWSNNKRPQQMLDRDPVQLEVKIDPFTALDLPGVKGNLRSFVRRWVDVYPLTTLASVSMHKWGVSNRHASEVRMLKLAQAVRSNFGTHTDWFPGTEDLGDEACWALRMLSHLERRNITTASLHAINLQSGSTYSGAVDDVCDSIALSLIPADIPTYVLEHHYATEECMTYLNAKRVSDAISSLRRRHNPAITLRARVALMNSIRAKL